VPDGFEDFEQTWNLSTDFHKRLNTKFRGNPSSGNRVNTYGLKDKRGEGNRLFSGLVKTPQRQIFTNTAM